MNAVRLSPSLYLCLCLSVVGVGGGLCAAAHAEEELRHRVTLELPPGERRLPALPPGAAVEAWGGSWVQISLPAAREADLRRTLADGGEGGAVRRPWQATAKAIQTEAYADLFPAGDWQEAGYTGRRQHIVVLDVGASGAEALAGEELPEEIGVLGDGEAGVSSHGVAVAEVIHDIAPEAEISFWVFRTDAEFLEALERLPTEAGPIDVVNASVGFDNVWHADGEGPLSRAVDAFVAETGAVWVSAAGNEEGRYRIGPLTVAEAEKEEEEEEEGTPQLALGGEAAVPLALSGGAATVSLRWSEPMEAAVTALRLEVVGEDGALCGEGTAEVETRPYIWVSAAGCGATASVRIGWEGEDAGELSAGLVGYLYAPGGFGEGEWATSGQTLTLPADARGALAVGACSESGAEGYSSRGPTEDGRLKPDLCARGRVSTATYGAGGFAGTSAAAPHVAGLAALLRSAGWDTAPSVRRALKDSARDVGEEGLDVQTGHGLAQLGAPPPRCGGQAGILGIMGVGWGWRRRRVARAGRVG